MEIVKIYLSGSMAGVSFEEQSEWRQRIIDAINYQYEHNKKAVFFNPVNFYNFEEKQQKSEKEVMEFDLYNLRNSDIVVVNFNNVWSIGTAMELMLAKEKHIPVIGWNSSGEELHPWLNECVTRLCDNLRETVEHVVEFYLKD
jgi:nucleoside 2-deoxyribosyltransferase